MYKINFRIETVKVTNVKLPLFKAIETCKKTEFNIVNGKMIKKSPETLYYYNEEGDTYKILSNGKITYFHDNDIDYPKEVKLLFMNNILIDTLMDERDYYVDNKLIYKAKEKDNPLKYKSNIYINENGLIKNIEVYRNNKMEKNVVYEYEFKEGFNIRLVLSTKIKTIPFFKTIKSYTGTITDYNNNRTIVNEYLFNKDGELKKTVYRKNEKNKHIEYAKDIRHNKDITFIKVIYYNNEPIEIIGEAEFDFYVNDKLMYSPQSNHGEYGYNYIINNDGVVEGFEFYLQDKLESKTVYKYNYREENSIKLLYNKIKNFIKR